MKIVRKGWRGKLGVHVELYEDKEQLISGISIDKYFKGPYTEPKINWGPLGSSSINDTENFIKLLQEAVVEAKKLKDISS